MSAPPDEARRAGGRGRFAPSTTGRAHPGTLLAGLLCWLDARSRGAEVILRLEDLDLERTKPGFVEAMVSDLEWLGLDWDGLARQSGHRAQHQAALDALIAEGRVYACACSRARIRESGLRAPDGSHRYEGHCRAAVVRKADDEIARGRSLRLRWDAMPVEIRDESGRDLSGDPARLFGDPILRRRDGAFAYHLASVVDDAAAGVGRVVRGRDLAPSTMLQVGLQRLLELPTPSYRHHCLFLESVGAKLSKMHGAVDVGSLRERHAPETLCGMLAGFVGLVPPGESCRPQELIDVFDWSRVSTRDVVLRWSPAKGLEPVGAGAGSDSEEAS